MPPGPDRNPTDVGAAEAARNIRGGTLWPVALVEACLARVRELDGALQAWVHVDEAGATAKARTAEREARAGRFHGVLHGVPVGIKDIMHVAGMPTRAGLAHAATAYIAANRARLRFRQEVIALLAEHDALLAPVAPSTAPAGLGSTGDASLCAPWSWTGVPAIALPSGLDAQGLPHSVQLVQAAGADGHLLSVASWCERVLAFPSAPAL